MSEEVKNSVESSNDQEAVRKSRIKLLSLIALFALPAILAKVILMNNWYNSGVTNKGVLIDPTASYDSLGAENPLENKSWQLAYLVPAECGDVCQAQVEIMRQSYIALGRYRNRVEPVLLMSSDSDSSIEPLEGFIQIPVSKKFLTELSPSDYVIVDPRGQLVMRYPEIEDTENLSIQNKGLLADLRKLLKLSRVG